MAVKTGGAAKKASGSSAAKGAAKKGTATSAGKTTARKKKPVKRDGNKGKTLEEIENYKDQQAFETGITIAVILLISVFLYLSYFQLAGSAGIVVGGLCFGIFGWFAWVLPLSVLICFVFYLVNRGDRRVWRRIFSYMGMVLSALAFTDVVFQKEIMTEYYTSNHVMHKGYTECMFLTCTDVIQKGKFNGGLIGRAVSSVFAGLLGRIGAAVILFVLFLLCLYIFYGVEMMGRIRKRNAYRSHMEEIVQEQEEYEEPSYRVFPEREARKKGRRVPKRDMPKAPRVQSFTLAGQDGECNVPGKEEQALEEKRKEIPEEKKEEQQATQDIKVKQEDFAEKEALEAEAIVTQESAAKQIEGIPIYRNELNKKFGGKSKEARLNLTPTAQVVSEPILTPVPEPEAGPQEMAESEPAEEEVYTPQKPLDSFVHREEVTDIRPKAQREAEERKQAKQAVSAKKEENAPVVQERTEKKQDREAEIPYQLPPLSLLSAPDDTENKISDEQLRKTALKLQETLKSFNVNVKMGAVTCGPAVTRYEMFPEQGVRVNKITNLADDLKLSLAAASIRIEAPIPGKAAVGIEVPNPTASPVPFRELLEDGTFCKAKSDLTFAVGKDIAGNLVMADIAKMPHLLIAGATGSGKSVCINTLIMSILYKADPKDVKLIMIDPKVVELSVYNGIPHLFCPVVTDPKEAAAALAWAVREMMERYNKFKELGVRNISGYNKKIKDTPNAAEAGYEKMPYLVVIVDEFADLMMVASKEVEDSVCRLAQLARAAGIHLVLATQRPSVNVITGVIKANIPSRIAFSVSSAIDSRTILDKGGAEKLLGKGDMLFFPSGYSEPVRVQGAFVTDQEVSSVVDFLCQNNATPEYNHAVTEAVELPQEETVTEKKTLPDRDEYFADAGRFVIESERASAGQLQRRFSIGFNRAGRIIDQLNKAGVVGAAEGTKPRKVLMTMEEFERLLGGVTQEEMEDMVQEMEVAEAVAAQEDYDEG